MSNEADITVVLCARNAATTIGEQLDALAAQTTGCTWEAVIVDDRSTDHTRDIIDQRLSRLPHATVVTGPGNGINAARNTGVRASNTERIIFCDADDVVDPGWIDAYHTAEWTLAGGTIALSALNGATARGRPSPTADGLPVSLGYLPYPIGANFGITRQLFDHLDGFSIDYKRGATEVEFAWRAQESGESITFIPAALVNYRLRTTATRRFIQSFIWARADARLIHNFALPHRSLLRRDIHKLEGYTAVQKSAQAAAYLCGMAIGEVHHSLVRWRASK